MAAPPGTMPSTREALIRPAEAVSDQPQSHNRRDVRQAVRVLLDLGYTATGGEAWRLIKEWRAWRDDDARRFIADEFRSWCEEHPSVIRVKSKPTSGEWRTAT